MAHVEIAHNIAITEALHAQCAASKILRAKIEAKTAAVDAKNVVLARQLTALQRKYMGYVYKSIDDLLRRRVANTRIAHTFEKWLTYITEIQQAGCACIFRLTFQYSHPDARWEATIYQFMDEHKPGVTAAYRMRANEADYSRFH